MVHSTTNDGLVITDVLEDLKTILDSVRQKDSGDGASYDEVQQALPNLHLHILTYIRFLENNDYVEYDRVADLIRVSTDGSAALVDPEIWRSKAQVAFAQHLSADAQTNVLSTSGSPLDDFDLEMDNLLDNLDGPSTRPLEDEDFYDEDATGLDISMPDLTRPNSRQQPSSLYFQADDEVDDDDEPDFVIEAIEEPSEADEDSEAVSEPELTTSPEWSTPPEAFPSDDRTTSTPTPNPEPTTSAMNQNDSFRDRRISSSTEAAPASAAGATTSSPTLYAREEEIGSGGMGTVFKARQVKLDRVVALKEIKEIFDVFAGVQRSDIVERFTQIIQAQAKITHPNIIQVLDIDTDARFPFVVMQYAPNGNLRRLIDVEGRPPLQVSLKYFLQILHALSTAHDHGIAHGGVKPENVVLDSAGNALLTDFGISQVVEMEGSRANQVYVGVGTVAYMSPEQFRDPNAASVKSDIYSLGIMFYEMLTGKVPGRRSPMPSSFYPDIPRKLDDIFDRMSMDDEADRFDTIDEILAEFYSSKEVMKILDKRGGFIFLRDPISHGATGLKVELDEDSDAGEGLGLGESSSSLGEDSSDVEDDGAAEPEALDEGDSSDADDDSDEEAEASEGDVLDKLDKYGKLFDDGDDDGDDGDEDDDD